MAKKILAVVLAVMMAVSAMAVSVFADVVPYQANAMEKKTIDLYPSRNPNEFNSGKTSGITLEFAIPVYALYGYMTEGYALELNLPTKIGDIPTGTKMNWAIVSGATVTNLMPVITTADFGLSTQYVFFSALVHDYVSGLWSSVPQATSFDQITGIKLVATYELNEANKTAPGADKFNANSDPGKQANIKAVKADTVPMGNPLPADYKDKVEMVNNGAITFMSSWVYTSGNGSSTSATNMDFVTDEWTSSYKDATANVLKFDHTLYNRNLILAAYYAGDYTAKLVVELNKPINGMAYYTLYAKADDAGTYATNDQWWAHSNTRTPVSQIFVNEKKDKLEFDVKISDLYSDKYGTYNKEFVIFENIVLNNETIMENYMKIDRNKVGGDAGDWGDVSWKASWTGDNAVYYKGDKVNYARAGKAGIGAPESEEVKVNLNVTADANGNAGKWGVATGLKVDPDKTYTLNLVAKEGKDVPNQIFFGTWGKLSDAAGVSNRAATIKMTGKEIMEKTQIAAGDEILVSANAWGKTAEKEAYDVEFVITSSVYTGQNAGADVTAKKIYIELSAPAASEPEQVAPPTEGPTVEEDPDQTPDDMGVEDKEPEKEDNPKTGVALALVPMMIAAAAAVVSKKH